MVTATDPDGETITTTVDFAIANIAPVKTSELPDQTETAGYPFTMLTAPVFVDPDADVLLYTATGLPSGLAIDPQTGEISGTIAQNAVSAAPDGDGVYSVTISVDDGQGGIAFESFLFAVHDLPFVGDSPVPKPPVPNDHSPNDDAGLTAPSLIVDRAVNLVRPLGIDTGLFGRYPVTEAVNGVSPLNPGINFDPADHPVTRTVSWINETRELLSRAVSNNSDGSGMTVWQGGDSKTVLLGEGLVVRTLVWQGVVYVEYLTQADMTLTAGIGGFDGLPAWASMVAPNLIAIRPPAASEDLLVSLAAPDGSRADFKLDTIGGIVEIKGDRLAQTAIPAELDAMLGLLGAAAENFSEIVLGAPG